MRLDGAYVANPSEIRRGGRARIVDLFVELRSRLAGLVRRREPTRQALLARERPRPERTTRRHAPLRRRSAKMRPISCSCRRWAFRTPAVSVQDASARASPAPCTGLPGSPSRDRGYRTRARRCPSGTPAPSAKALGARASSRRTPMPLLVAAKNPDLPGCSRGRKAWRTPRHCLHHLVDYAVFGAGYLRARKRGPAIVDADRSRTMHSPGGLS